MVCSCSGEFKHKTYLGWGLCESSDVACGVRQGTAAGSGGYSGRRSGTH
jgi:hypothetical protein